MSSKVSPSLSKDRAASPWQRNDAGPSVIRTDDPTFARLVGLIGAGFMLLGGLPFVLAGSGRATFVGPGIATLLLSAGILGLLFHAAFDWDVQFRRIYMVFGFVVFGLGVLLAVLPYPDHAGDQFLKGFVCLLLALLFLLAFLRNEDDPWMRNVTLTFLGAAAAVMAVVGLFGGNIKGEFLMPYGVLLGLLGLAYGTAFIMGRGISEDWGHRAGLIMGGLGVLVLVVALGRSALPPLFDNFGWLSSPPEKYLVPSGLLLVLLGAFYALTALGLCSDNRLVVLTVRELGAQFCSPIAYMVLFAFVLAHWMAYGMYLGQMVDRTGNPIPIQEPMITGFILQWLAVIFTIVLVPVLTMRLVSEEKRSGTIEVLLTAPVEEGSVVLSKFLAAWLMFLFMWLPFLLFLIALRIDGGQPFDYRPLFSFFTGLCITGAGFVSMGVFFSSLTRNQIISVVLTIAGMLFLMMTYMLQGLFDESVWANVFKHMSFIDVWFDTLKGNLVPLRLLFFGSMAIFFLFVSVKVLEARKWA
ncbi:MAG TPA: ABC transporter permease [Gemmataceae bacterium]|jgi:ABC-type transport system involved in multi-copper enzyme maturation permease subunit